MNHITVAGWIVSGWVLDIEEPIERRTSESVDGNRKEKHWTPGYGRVSAWLPASLPCTRASSFYQRPSKLRNRQKSEPRTSSAQRH